MTRELKLALIVGFALVLTVAILVSDHLSKARTATLASVGGTQKVVAKVPDSPIRSLDDLIPTSLPAAVEVATPAVAASDSPEVTPMDTGMPMSAPVVIGQQQVGGLHESKFGSGRAEGAGSLSASIREHADVSAVTPTFGSSMAPAGETPRDILQAEIKKSEPSKAAPLAGEKTYKVVSGDSLYAIAKKFYNDGTQWKRIVAANPGKATESGSIKIGTTIVIPGKEAEKTSLIAASKPAAKVETKATKVEESKAKSYQVRPGDTLTSIARKQLGSPSRAGDIASLNKMDPEDDLLAGAILKIPAH
ncbi:MAG: LysM peptidoglycan-binding domain-containing protein [Phycisphaeraceae bacterium]|nr:LysM peptidoglycan-binding domain-containing protein [Phycisphaeraceae bacterium]